MVTLLCCVDMSSTTNTGETFACFDKLSDDIILMIFKNLNNYELLVIRNVCRRFQTIATDRELTK